MSQTGIQCRSLAGIRDNEQPDSHFVDELLANYFAGVVLRTIVNDDDFETRIIRRKETANRILDDEFFVVRRNKN